MIYRITSGEYHAINAVMPDGIEFGYESNGEYFFDDFVRPYFNFDIDSKLLSVVGQNYDDFIAGLNSLDQEHIKIYRYIHEMHYEDFCKPPKEHNYKSGLSTTDGTPFNLIPVPTFIKGELQRMDYYADEASTDLVLRVDMTYTRDEFGWALTRTTTRTWYKENGDAHPDTKITIKRYYRDINLMEEESVKRRGNIVKTAKLSVLALLKEVYTDKSTFEIAAMGYAFLEEFSSEFSSFARDGIVIIDMADPYVGKKAIVKLIGEADLVKYPWMTATPASLHGATIQQFVMNSFDI